MLAPYLPHPPSHGGRIRSRLLLSGLQQVGDVTLAVPQMALADHDVAAIGVPALPVPAALAAAPSARRKLATWARGRSEVLGRRWEPASRDAVRQLLGSGVDLLVLDGSHVLPAVPTEVTQPRLFHLHNVESAVLRRPDQVARGPAERVVRCIEGGLMARLEARHAAAARLCLTVSALDRDRLLELCPSAIVDVVENAIDLDARPRLPPSANVDAPLLLFVGSYEYPPNLEAARELLQQHLPVLRARWPDLRVRCVGADPAGAVRALAETAGAEAPGRVDDLAAHYREAAAVYAPLRSGGGTRIKALEAFAFGRPLLATAVAVEALPIEDGVHYLRVETAADGVQALARVVAGEVTPLVDAARELVECRFGMDAAVARVAALVRQHFDA